MWAIGIVTAAAVLALFVFGAWFVAIPLALLVLGIGLGFRASGRFGESGRLRRFRRQAGDAAPDTETLST